jgi:hypothetical protein
MTSWQVGHVELLEVDLSINRGRFGVLQFFLGNENPVVVATQPYDPSASGGGKFRPAITASAGHGLAFPDGGCIRTGYVAVDANTPRPVPSHRYDRPVLVPVLRGGRDRNVGRTTNDKSDD